MPNQSPTGDNYWHDPLAVTKNNPDQPDSKWCCSVRGPNGSVIARTFSASRTRIRCAPHTRFNASLIASARARAKSASSPSARRANAIQHSGGIITPEDWSELFALQNEAFAFMS